MLARWVRKGRLYRYGRAGDGMKEYLLDSYFKIDKVIDGLVYG